MDDLNVSTGYVSVVKDSFEDFSTVDEFIEFIKKWWLDDVCEKVVWKIDNKITWEHNVFTKSLSLKCYFKSEEISQPLHLVIYPANTLEETVKSFYGMLRMTYLYKSIKNTFGDMEDSFFIMYKAQAVSEILLAFNRLRSYLGTKYKGVFV